MNIDADKISAFLVNDLLGKAVSRIFPGIILYIILNMSLEINLPGDSLLFAMLTLSLYWLLGFSMEFYNRRIPFIKKFYRLHESLEPQKRSIIFLINNLVSGILWGGIIYYLRELYREVYTQLRFEITYSQFEESGQIGHNSTPYEFQLVTIALGVALFLVAFLMTRDAKKKYV